MLNDHFPRKESGSQRGNGGCPPPKVEARCVRGGQDGSGDDEKGGIHGSVEKFPFRTRVENDCGGGDDALGSRQETQERAHTDVCTQFFGPSKGHPK